MHLFISCNFFCGSLGVFLVYFFKCLLVVLGVRFGDEDGVQMEMESVSVGHGGFVENIYTYKAI